MVKKLLFLTTLALFSSGLYLVLPKGAAAAPPPPMNAVAAVHTAADDTPDTRQVIITASHPAANDQIQLHYGDESTRHVGATGEDGIPISVDTQMILTLFTPAENSFYEFKSAIINGDEITELPHNIPAGEDDLNIYVEFTSVDFAVVTEIYDNEGNALSGAQYTDILNYITVPAVVTVGDNFAVTVDEDALYAGEFYTLSGIQVRTFHPNGDVKTPYDPYAGAAAVNSQFIELYSKNTRSIVVRINLVKKYRLSIIAPTDANIEWQLNILDDGEIPMRDSGGGYLVDSGSIITISTQVMNNYTANDGFAGLPDVTVLTTDTALTKETEFSIRQDSTVELLIAPRVFTLSSSVTDNPNYRLTKNTVALGDKIGITLQNIAENYGVKSWTINGRDYTVAGNTVYITADKLWFQTNDKFIDMENGIIEINSDPTMALKNDIFLVFGLPAGIVLLMLAIMFIIVGINKKRSETVKEYLLGTGKTYRKKMKRDKRQAAIDRHNAELAEFQKAKQEKLDARNAVKAETDARKKEEEENIRKQNKMTVEEKQALYEQQAAEAAEYRMPGAEGAAAPAPKPTASMQDIMNSKYDNAEETTAPTETPTEPPAAEITTETPQFDMPAAPSAEEPQFNMPTAPVEPEPAAAAETAPAVTTVPEPIIPAPTVTEQPAPAPAPVPAPVTVTPAPVPPPAAPQPAPIPTPVSAPTMPPPPRPAPTIPPRPAMPQPPAPQRPIMPPPPPMGPRPAAPQPPVPMGGRPQPQPLVGKHIVPGQPVPPRIPQPPTPPSAPQRPMPPVPPRQ